MNCKVQPKLYVLPESQQGERRGHGGRYSRGKKKARNLKKYSYSSAVQVELGWLRAQL